MCLELISPSKVRMATTEMHSGTVFDLLNPVAEQVLVSDIAHHLAHICRFGGGTPRFYSVAEHSIMVMRYVEMRGGSPSDLLAALLHDGHEAYIGDVTTPVKEMLGARYIDLRDRLDGAIAEKFGIRLADFHSRLVREADQAMLATEAHYYMISGGEGEHWGGRLMEMTPFDLALNRPKMLSPNAAKDEFVYQYNKIIASQVAEGGAATYAM